MRRSEVRVDSAVPGFEEDRVHTELARANLFRLRGEYAEAERICLEVLKQNSDSAAAHILLGDIATAQRKPAEAAEHYQIAKDLDPSAPDIPRKLDVARVQAEQQEIASAEEQLGLPPRPRLPWPALAFGALAIVSLVAAYVAGNTGRSRPTASVGRPIVATTEAVSRPQVIRPTEPTVSTPATAPATAPAKEEPKPSETVATPAPVGTTDDRALLQLVQSRSSEGARLTALNQDPRTRLVVLTYQVGAQDDARKIGAELARATLESSGDTLQVTMRAIRDDRLAYVADFPRTRYADTILDSWVHDHPAPDAWIPYVVTNEWPARSPDAGS